MRKISPRRLRRMQARMLSGLGLDLKELGAADEVLIKFPDKQLLIRGASVIQVNLEGERVFQLIGGEVEEKEAEELIEEEYVPPEEDVALVAAQAGVDENLAREALKEVRGDLAKAILLLKSKRS
ncbi:MAG: hypothetical protein B6U65_03325 [Candidatus Wolframiiraptor sp. EX4484-121]|nr:MAG: hypothetical protein B6U65_03325 [Candidatus Wolframiiraptor sp. EX4484-121]